MNRNKGILCKNPCCNESVSPGTLYGIVHTGELTRERLVTNTRYDSTPLARLPFVSLTVLSLRPRSRHPPPSVDVPSLGLVDDGRLDRPSLLGKSERGPRPPKLAEKGT